MIFNERIYLTKNEITLCKNFSKLVLETNTYYKSRGQSNLEAIFFQITIGKMGEVASKHFLENRGNVCSDVDFSIYKTGKTFNPDFILFPDIKIHIKSQSTESSRLYGLSWTFQYGNRKNGKFDAEIFENFGNKDSVIFCLIDYNNCFVDIISSFTVKNLHNKKLFKDPIKQNLVGEKKVVYYKDMINL